MTMSETIVYNTARHAINSIANFASGAILYVVLELIGGRRGDTIRYAMKCRSQLYETYRFESAAIRDPSQQRDYVLFAIDVCNHADVDIFIQKVSNIWMGMGRFASVMLSGIILKDNIESAVSKIVTWFERATADQSAYAVPIMQPRPQYL